MKKKEIMEILPHREDMLLLDEVYEKDGLAIGYYKVRGNEFFLKGHFPDNPIVPGVILCEILAQSACILLKDKITKNSRPFYTGLKNVKFKNPVVPDDLIETRCEIVREKHPFYFAKGEVFVGEKLCVIAEYSFAVLGE